MWFGIGANRVWIRGALVEANLAQQVAIEEALFQFDDGGEEDATLADCDFQLSDDELYDDTAA